MTRITRGPAGSPSALLKFLGVAHGPCPVPGVFPACHPLKGHRFGVLYVRTFIRFKNFRKRGGLCNIQVLVSFLFNREVSHPLTEEAIMSGKDKNKKPAPKPDAKEDKKTSETVHLSAEELRKISGGVGVTYPETSPHALAWRELGQTA